MPAKDKTKTIRFINCDNITEGLKSLRFEKFEEFRVQRSVFRVKDKKKIKHED